LKSGEAISADLVIDASGRRSKMPQWLRAAGYGTPQRVEVDSGIGYGVRMYEMPDKVGSATVAVVTYLNTWPFPAH
jgi:hypothetical protein